MTKVLVTGACGFIGSHVVALLINEGHTVLCLDDLSSGKRENIPAGVEFAQVDVANWWDLVAEFVDFEPEAVIHLAAQPSICDSVDNPIRDAHVNVMGTLNCLRAAQKIGATRFVFSSTSAVYSEEHYEYTSLPLTEPEPMRPGSPYGISKMAAESYVHNLMPDGGTVLRFGNVYGPRQVPLGENQVIPKMIRHLEFGDPFYINGDGEQKRDFVYVEDVARACVMALTGQVGIYNISTGRSHSVNDVAAMLSDIYGVKYQWEHNDKQDARRECCLNNNKASDDLGWAPVIDLLSGLEHTVEWWKK